MSALYRIFFGHTYRSVTVIFDRRRSGQLSRCYHGGIDGVMPSGFLIRAYRCNVREEFRRELWNWTELDVSSQLTKGFRGHPRNFNWSSFMSTF